MGVEEPFRGVLVGQLERQGDLHVTTCELAIPIQQWRRFRFNYGDHGHIIAYDAADTKVVSLTSNGSIYVHSVFDLEPLQLIQSDLVLHCVCLSQDSHRYICCGSNLGEIHVWNAFNSQRYTTYKAHGDAVKRIAINNDDSYVASCSDHNLVFYSLILSKIVHEVSHSSITNLVFSPLRKYLICATDDSGSVTIYDVKSKSIVVKFANIHNAPVTGAAFSPTNKVFFVTCGLDRIVSFFDIGAKLKIGTRIQTEAPLTALQFAPNGVSIVLTDSLFQTTIYDLRSTSQPLLKFPGAFTRLLKYVTLPIHQALGSATSTTSHVSDVAPPTSSSFFSPIRSSKNLTSGPESLQSSAPSVGSMSAMFSPLRPTSEYKLPEKPALCSGESGASKEPSRPEITRTASDREIAKADGPLDSRDSMSILMKGSSLFSPVQFRKNSNMSLTGSDRGKPTNVSHKFRSLHSKATPGEYHDDILRQADGSDLDPLRNSLNDTELSGLSEKMSETRPLSPVLSMPGSDDDQPMPLKLSPSDSNRNSPVPGEEISTHNMADENRKNFGNLKPESKPSSDSPPANEQKPDPTKASVSHQPAEGVFEPPSLPLQTNAQSMAPAGVSIQAEIIRSALDESIIAIRNDIRNLHLDMVRYFHGQKMELAAQFNTELEKLRHELAQTLADNQKLRQQIARFGPFPITE